jgi:hypothetical protein
MTVLLAACTTGGTPPTAPASPAPLTPGATATAPQPAPTTGGTPEPSQVVSTPSAEPTSTGQAAVSPTAEPSAAPSLSGDLESLVPTDIAGHTMTIEPASDPVWSLLNLWSDEAIGRALLDSLGKSEDDIDVVFSYTEADVPQIIVNAYRVAGADGEALKDGMVAEYLAMFEEHGAVITETTLGGKDVSVMSTENAPAGVGEHFYAVGDVVFSVSANPPEWVEDALQALP